MARLARVLYAGGLAPHQVLHECYGVSFPDELFVIAEADTPRILARYANQPWQMAVPPDRGGPAAEPDSMDNVERRLLACEPNLVPLVLCLNTYAGYGGLVLCYALDELAAGRSTVFGIDRDLAPDSRIARCADSLLAALHTHHAAHADWVERAWRESAAASDNVVDEDDLAAARSFLDRVTKLRWRAGV